MLCDSGTHTRIKLNCAARTASQKGWGKTSRPPEWWYAGRASVGHDEAVVVVGMLADEVDAPRGADDERGRSVERLVEMGMDGGEHRWLPQ